MEGDFLHLRTNRAACSAQNGVTYACGGSGGGGCLLPACSPPSTTPQQTLLELSPSCLGKGLHETPGPSAAGHRVTRDKCID